MRAAQQDDVEALLGRLVAVDSTSSRSNRALVDRICERLDGPGVTLERLEDDGKIELVARAGPPPLAAERAGLVLSGHTDTVPAGEPGWRSDPFALADGGDRWFGRGTCDMKGFLALAIETFGRFAQADLTAPLVLLLTSDEEVGSLGAQRLARRLDPQELPRACVIGEPTSLALVHRHKGHLRLRLDLGGIAAHSGFPHRGASAIEAAGPALAALSELQAAWRDDRSRRDQDLEVPWLTLNVGTIRGGRAVNIVADECVLEIGVRPLPGVASAALVEEIRTVLADSLDELPDIRWSLEIENDSPSMLTPATARLPSELAELLGVAPTGTSFASDGGAFQELGLESVLWGPGSIEVAHKPNEYLPKDELYRAGAVLDELVRRFCAS